MIRICGHCGRIHKAFGFWFDYGNCPECGLHAWCTSIRIGDSIKIHVYEGY